MFDFKEFSIWLGVLIVLGLSAIWSISIPWLFLLTFGLFLCFLVAFILDYRWYVMQAVLCLGSGSFFIYWAVNNAPAELLTKQGEKVIGALAFLVGVGAAYLVTIAFNKLIALKAQRQAKQAERLRQEWIRVAGNTGWLP